MQMRTVLLMEASSRQVLPMARAFHKLGYRVITVCEKRTDLGAVTRFSDINYSIAKVDSDAEVANAKYNKIIMDEKINLVVPLSDFSAEIAARNKVEWNKKGIQVAVNDWDIFVMAYDKLNTMRVCMENAIPCPATILVDENKEVDFSKVKYPVVVKPRSACGSIGFHIVNNEDVLKKLLADKSHGPLLIQEFIPQSGRQYNAHFFMDEKQDVKTAICTQKCRWFPIDGGASTLCRTVDRADILSCCEKLLKKIGWVGYCDLDLMEDPRDGSVRIIEINARISANVKICFAVGADIAKQIDQLYFSNAVDKVNSYECDRRLRCMHTDLLWFVKSPMRLKSDPSWFDIARQTDQIWSWDDPIPFITFSFGALFKYKKEIKKRER